MTLTRILLEWTYPLYKDIPEARYSAMLGLLLRLRDHGHISAGECKKAIDQLNKEHANIP